MVRVNKERLFTYGPLSVVVFIVFYFGVYFWGSQSDGFRFLDNAIRSSTEIHRRVGKVQSVRMNFWRGYQEKYIDSDKTVMMTLDVKGSNRAVRIRAVVKRINGVWSIYESTIDGDRVTLN